jgi:RNA polymerase sigma-70 factor (ECF subfamily)
MKDEARSASPGGHLRIVPKDGAAPSEPGTLESAFRRFGPYVARIAYRLLGRYQEVEDVVQDVFIEAARGLHRLQDPEALKGWLAAITVRLCTKRLRMRRLRRWVSLDDETDYMDVEARGASAEQRVLLAQIYRTLDDVAVPSRVAWTLRYLHDQPLEVVAVQCGCSLATAKRRIGEAQALIDKAVSR